MALITNLVSYWKLDGNSNDSVASNNGTDTAISYSVANGKLSQGAGFNGTTSKITFPNLPTSGSSAFSITAWIKTSGSNSLQFPIVVYGASSADNSVFFRTNTNATPANCTLHADFYGGGGGIDSSTAIADGNWHYAVVTYGGAGTPFKIYIDGVLNATGSNYTGNITSGNNYIGYDGGAFYNGAIDEVGIWSRALTALEITSLYNTYTGLTYPFIITQPTFLLNFI